MWALRAAVRRGAWLSRSVRGRPAPRPAPPRPWTESRAFGTGAAGAAGGARGGGGRGRGGGGASEEAEAEAEADGEEEPEDAGDEEEEEDEELLRAEPLLPSGAQRVCLVHPDVKGGPRRPTLTRAEWQVAEARALVQTLDLWSVAEALVVPTRTPDKKLIFGRGALEQLTEKIRGRSDVTAVFLNVERLSAPTKKELEAAWRVPVFDRFTMVLHIFRCHARTKEARLQVALAELPLLRSRMWQDLGRTDGPGGNTRYTLGSGETYQQLQRRRLREREAAIRRALERLQRKRQLLGRQRRRREFPVVSVVGYTNCERKGAGRREPEAAASRTPATGIEPGALPSAGRRRRCPPSRPGFGRSDFFKKIISLSREERRRGGWKRHRWERTSTGRLPPIPPPVGTEPASRARA